MIRPPPGTTLPDTLFRYTPLLHSPAGTTRGFGQAEFTAIGDMIADVLDGLAANGAEGNGAVEAEVRARVKALCDRLPIYPGFRSAEHTSELQSLMRISYAVFCLHKTNMIQHKHTHATSQ